MRQNAAVIVVFSDLLSRPFPALNPTIKNRNRFQIEGFRGQGYVDELCVFLAKSQDFYDESIPVGSDRITEAEKAIEVFRKDFDRMCAEVTTEWGGPTFRNARLDAQGFGHAFANGFDDCHLKPLEQQLWLRGAVALAYWDRQHRVAYLAVEHQDKELPVIMVVGTRRKPGPMINIDQRQLPPAADKPGSP